MKSVRESPKTNGAVMTRCLSKVEDTFMIRGRGLIFVPGLVPQGDEQFQVGDPLLLKRPDGLTMQTEIGGLALICPNPRLEVVVLLKGFTKEELPIGTEVWSVDSE